MGWLMSCVGRFCTRFRWPVVVVWVLLAVGLTVFTGSVPSTTTNEVSLPGTGSQAATDLLTKEFPPQQNGSNPAVYHVKNGRLDDKGPNQQAIVAAYKQLKKQPQVDSVTNPFANPQAGLVSDDGKYAFIPILLRTPTNDLTVREATKLHDIATQGPVSQGIEAAVGGAIGSTLNVIDTATSERLGMAAAAVILALTFASLVAMGMPLISAVIGLLVGIASIWFVGLVLDIPTVGTTMARMIGLGVGIDYALFMVNKHRRNISEKGMDPRTAAAMATGTSGGAIIFAGGTVVIALVSLQVAGIPFIAGLGYASAAAVAFSVLAAVTFLPALLAIVGRWVMRVRLPFIGRRTDHPIGSRWAGLVTRHPIVSTLAALALLAPLIVPVTSLFLGQQDLAVSPKGTSQRVAFDLMSQGFGPGYNGPLVVAMSMDPKATPSEKYDDQYNEATSLQKQLEAEQQSLTQQQAELEQQQAALEDSAAELQAEATALEAEQATLEAEAESLQEQQAGIEAEAQRLEREVERLATEAERLVAEAERLLAKERTLLKDLRKNRRAMRELERRIDRTRDPVVRAELEDRLEQRERDGKTWRTQLKKNTRKLKDLRVQGAEVRAQGEQLRAQAGQLRNQVQVLERQAGELQAEGEELEAEGQELQQQQAALEAEAASLQEWGDELQEQADEAKQQQKQAEQLQQQLTKELTKAGGDPRGTDPRIVKMQNALAKPQDVQTVTPPQINKPGTAVIMSVIAKTQPADPKTAALVQQLRDETIPAAISPGMTADVGGSTASNVDLATLITDKLPLVIATVVLLSTVLMLLAFRSLLIPLQAAVANIVAAAAAFGVLTAVFQWGWGLPFIGMETSSGSLPVISYVPLMMFAALFGLSMDYQVFVVSTIQNEVAVGKEPKQAIKDGLAYAGRIVLTAALIMMSVFGSFVLNDQEVIKQFGVGLTTAVALAAFMVLLFTPAVMTLFHRSAFRLPRWLDRILPDLDLEGRKLEAEWDARQSGGGPHDRPDSDGRTVPGAEILPGGQKD